MPVVAIGRDERRLHALAARGSLVAPYAADLGEVDQPPALASRIVSDHPEVACLINNAGIQNNLRLDDAGCDSRKIRHAVDVNLVAPMVLSHALLPLLQGKQLAWIVNVTSSASCSAADPGRPPEAFQ